MADDDEKEKVDGEGVEGEDGAEGEEGAEAKSGLKKKLLLILIPVILLAIGGGLYMSGVIGGGGEDVAAETSELELEEEAEEETESAFFPLPDLIVNLSSQSGARYLKLRVQLEIKDKADLPKIEVVAPRVIDQFQTYLREMRVEDLRGSAGIYRLRQELLYRVNIAADPVKVKDVLFQEMLIQ